MADTTMKKWNGTSWETIYPETTVGQIVASGTPGSSNFLRGDGVWSAPDFSGLATETYVDTAVSNLVDTAPATLDTLNELAAALGDDPNFATTVTNSIAGKVAKTGDTMTGALTMGNNYIYGDLTTTKLRVGSTAEFATVRSMEIRADDDDSSNTEYLKLMAGQNTLQITSTSGGGTDLNKLTYNGHKVLTSVTGAKRIDLTTQVQLASYRKSVIALCDLTNTNPSNNSWSGGTIYFHRTNGLSAPVTLQIAMEKRYNSVGANYTALVMSGDSFGDNIQYIKFQKDGVWYGGIEFFFSNAEHSQVYFIGETNFDIFGLDYYNTQTSSAINTEVNNSITTSDMTAETDFFFNGQTIWHSGNAADADTKVSKSGDTMSGALTVDNTLTINRAATAYGALLAFSEAGTNQWFLKHDFDGGNNNSLQLANSSQTVTTTFEQNGNVGIGTTSPTAKLHLSDAGNGAVTTFNANGRITMRGDGVINWGSTAQYGQLTWNTNQAIVKAQSSTALHLGANDNNNHMVINTSGNVGIGTTSPGYKLQVNGTFNATDPMINSASTSNDASVMQWRYGTSDAYRLRLKQTVTSGVVRWNFSQTNNNTSYNDVLVLDRGNVGIGTTSPAYKLDVAGTGQFLSDSSTQRVLYLKQNAAGQGNIIQFQGAAGQNVWEITARDDNFYIYNNDLSKRAIYIEDSTNYIGINNNTSPSQALDVTGSIRASNDMYAARYYDLNNTAYYLDAASTSVLNAVGYNVLDGPTSQTRDKIRVWKGGTYTIGMKTGYTYGGLNNDYAMSFQMNDSNSRGFWWGDTAHTDAQGAMSLTTNGLLTVAGGARIGFGESTTATPSASGLDVSGNVTSNGNKLAWVRTQGTTNQSGVNFTLSGTTLYISTTL